MYFWWSYVVESFYFSSLNIKSVGGLVLSCFVVACMSVLLEFLKLLQAKHRHKELIFKSRQLRTICPATETCTLLREGANPIVVTLKDKIILHLLDGVLWFSTFNLSYLIMLAVMIYNGWLVISIVIGGGIGYFIFGQSFMKINVQNCNILRETYCMLNCGDPDPSLLEGESTPLNTPSTSGEIRQPAETQASVHIDS